MPAKLPAPELSIVGTYSQYEVLRMLRLTYPDVRALLEAELLDERVIRGHSRVTGASIARYLGIPITNLPDPVPQVARVRSEEEILADWRGR